MTNTTNCIERPAGVATEPNSMRLLLCVWFGALVLPFSATAEPTRILPLSGMGASGESPVYWDFKLDRGRGSGRWTRIKVPSCWEQEGFGAYYYGGQGRHKPDDDPIIPKETGVYRRTFELPASWLDGSVHLVFEGAMTDTTVTINGKSAGPTHQGGFYRFSYEITKLIKAGTNQIEVTVSKESGNKSVNFAERRGDYWTFGGIFRPVWLEARPVRHIDWTAIDARADGSFYARAHLNGPVPAGLRAQARVADSSGRIVGTFEGRWLRDTAIFVGQVPSPSQWSAETPSLYSAEFLLLDGEAPVHELRQRFGFRTLEVRPRDGVYLNGRKIVLKGINRHSFRANTGRTLSDAENLEDVRLIKAANMNAVRMSHYPPDSSFLRAADELGLYVLNELAGWQGFYDTATGARLIGQIVRRDVNHPSILFWDNGNEGGWNRENDGEFDRWDPQRRPVLHPWGIHSGINTDHYENYESTVRLSAGPDIFMPTEFLHGLFDGGIGAGLRDYWNVMRASPTVAGGFFWSFADEGVARTDQEGRIDTMGNLAPDGFVGPRHEKEGSYFAVKEIWSPVEISHLSLTDGVLSMSVRNGYDFIDLERCTAQWRISNLPQPGAHGAATVIATGNVRVPNVAVGESRDWQLPISVKQLGQNQILELAVLDPRGHELWVWTLRDAKPKRVSATSNPAPRITVHGAAVRAGGFRLHFDMETGGLERIETGNRSLPLRGPHLTAWVREPGRRTFAPIATSRIRSVELAPKNEPGVLARMLYDGPLREVVWQLEGEGLSVRYSIEYTGFADILGIKFDYPVDRVMGKRWVGAGPYRIWKNRLAGTRFTAHEAPYSAPADGKLNRYPEFEGFFGDWHWLQMQTLDGDVQIRNASEIPFFGLYRAEAGVGVIELPDSGWSFLHAVPPIGTKFDLPEVLGPQSQPTAIDGVIHGELRLVFSRR
jgi:hypothetical protein